MLGTQLMSFSLLLVFCLLGQDNEPLKYVYLQLLVVCAFPFLFMTFLSRKILYPKDILS